MSGYSSWYPTEILPAFLGGELNRDRYHPSRRDFLLCFALLSPPLLDSARTGCGMWEVGSSPAVAPLGWHVPRRGPEAGAGEVPLCPPAHPGKPVSAPSLPFQQPVSPGWRAAVIFLPHPTSSPHLPLCSLLAPGSRGALPKELALSLAFTTLGKGAPCMLCWEADGGKEPSPYITGRARLPSLALTLASPGLQG